MVDRGAFLTACRKYAPRLAPWVHWCYELPSRLLFHHYVLHSSAGVQQGDALGPLLFSLALQPILLALEGIAGIDITVGYLDDVVIAGSDTAVLQAYQYLQHAAPQVGLQLNQLQALRPRVA